MRLAKVLGPAVIAALIATALIGVNSGSAEPTELEKVVFCKKLQNPCEKDNHIAVDTKFHGELNGGNVSVLLGRDETGEFQILCSESYFSGKVEGLLAEGVIEKLVLDECVNTRDGEECTINTERLPYSFTGELELDHEHYELLFTEGLEEAPEFKVVCTSIGIDCKYSAGAFLFLQLHNLINNDAVFDISQDINGLGSCLTTTWHAKYLTRCLNGQSQFVSCWLAMEK